MAAIWPYDVVNRGGEEGNKWRFCGALFYVSIREFTL
jgi:hypothetical protein